MRARCDHVRCNQDGKLMGPLFIKFKPESLPFHFSLPRGQWPNLIAIDSLVTLIKIFVVLLHNKRGWYLCFPKKIRDFTFDYYNPSLFGHFLLNKIIFSSKFLIQNYYYEFQNNEYHLQLIKINCIYQNPPLAEVLIAN
jgi:hypothetical protein